MFLGLTPARPTDDAALQAAVAGANDAVAAWRADLADLDTWPAAADQAATLSRRSTLRAQVERAGRGRIPRGRGSVSIAQGPDVPFAYSG